MVVYEIEVFKIEIQDQLHIRALHGVVICGEFHGYCNRTTVHRRRMSCSVVQLLLIDPPVQCGEIAVVICINNCGVVAVLFCCSAV